MADSNGFVFDEERQFPKFRMEPWNGKMTVSKEGEKKIKVLFLKKKKNYRNI